MLNILNRKSSTTLNELTPNACAAVLSFCADLISRNKFLDDAIPWIEEAISMEMIPPLLEIPRKNSGFPVQVIFFSHKLWCKGCGVISKVIEVGLGLVLVQSVSVFLDY